jgi:copper(I)-binding protein
MEIVMRSCVLALALLAVPASAHEAMPGGAAPVAISDAWIRALPAGVPSGGYFTLRNTGDKPLRLTGASTPACGMLMLHKSELGQGMATMEDVAAIDIAAHGTLSFAPGGYHLMCMDAKPAIRPGNSVRVTLRFADGTQAQADFAVKNAAGR